MQNASTILLYNSAELNQFSILRKLLINMFVLFWFQIEICSSADLIGEEISQNGKFFEIRSYVKDGIILSHSNNVIISQKTIAGNYLVLKFLTFFIQ